MSESNETAPFLVDASRARRVQAFGDEVLIHVSSSQTGGRFSIIEQRCPTNAWGWEHRHKYEDHYVQVVDGEMEFEVDGTFYNCCLGQSLFIPRMKWHRFRSVGESEATMLFFNLPGGIEEMFIAIERAEQIHGLSDETALSIAETFGVEVRKQ